MIVILRRKELRNNQIKCESDVYDIELEEVYDDTNYVYDQNHYLRMNYKLDNYDIGIYHELNFDELYVETNQALE
jgi:hypothetical protein